MARVLTLLTKVPHVTPRYIKSANEGLLSRLLSMFGDPIAVKAYFPDTSLRIILEVLLIRS